MTREVSRTTFRERYHILLQHLHKKIKSGEWPPDTYIPAENDLAQQFQLSRPSVRKALSELAEAGLIRTLHGKGSLVNDPEQRPATLHLSWYTPSYEYEAVSRLIDRFNRTQTRIRVEMIPTPNGALKASARDGFRIGHTQPDLIGISNTSFFQFTGEEPDNWFRPLQLESARELYAPCLRAFTVNEKLLAAPLTFTPIMLVYNKSMFDHAGLAYPDASWTWDELLAAASSLTRHEGDHVEQYGFSLSSSYNRWPLFVLQNGGVFRRGDKLLPDEPATKEALQFAVDLMYKHKVSPIFSTDNFRLGEMLFLREKVAMILTSYLFLEEFRDIEFDWDLVRFPGRVADTGYSLATGIGISSHCEQVEEATEVIEYLLSEEAQRFLKQHGCSVPSRRTVAEDRSAPHHPKAGPGYYMFESIKDNAQTVIDFGLTSLQFNALNRELGLVWANVASLDDVWGTLRTKWAEEP